MGLLSLLPWHQDRSPKKKKKSPIRSATSGELRKCHLYQKAVDKYNGIRGRSSLVRHVGDKLDWMSGHIFQLLLSTHFGIAVDDSVAMYVRKVNAATIRFANPIPRVQDSMTRTKNQAVWALKRFFPPFIAARWILDTTLAMLCLTVALMRDLSRTISDEFGDVFYPKEIRFSDKPKNDWSVGTVFYSPHEHDPRDDEDGSPVRPMRPTFTTRRMRQAAAEAERKAAEEAARKAAEDEERRAAEEAEVKAAEEEERKARREAGYQIEESESENDSEEEFDFVVSQLPCYEPFVHQDIRYPMVPPQRHAISPPKESVKVKAKKQKFIDIYRYPNGIRNGNEMLRLLLDVILDFILSVTNVVLVFSTIWPMIGICVTIPLIKQVHIISGGFDPETPEEKKERQELMRRMMACYVQTYPRVKEIKQKEWLVDFVINHYVKTLSKWPIIGTIIRLCVRQHPLNLFAKITSKFWSYFGVVDEMDDIEENSQEADRDRDRNGDEDRGNDDSHEYNSNAGLDTDVQTYNDGFCEGNEQSYHTAPPRTSPSGQDNASYQFTAGEQDIPGKTSCRRKTHPAKITFNGESTRRVRRKSGVNASSTPKDYDRKMDIPGSSSEMTTEDVTNILSFEDEEPIVLGPLSPEKLKQIKTRDPVQAAIIRMKGDRIIEFKRRMKEKKQEQKSKNKKKTIKSATPGCEVIYEMPEKSPNENEDGELEEENEDEIYSHHTQTYDEYTNKAEARAIMAAYKQLYPDEGKVTSMFEMEVHSECFDDNTANYGTIPADVTESFENADSGSMTECGEMADIPVSDKFPTEPSSEDSTHFSKELYGDGVFSSLGYPPLDNFSKDPEENMLEISNSPHKSDHTKEVESAFGNSQLDYLKPPLEKRPIYCPFERLGLNSALESIQDTDKKILQKSAKEDFSDKISNSFHEIDHTFSRSQENIPESQRPQAAPSTSPEINDSIKDCPAPIEDISSEEFNNGTPGSTEIKTGTERISIYPKDETISEAFLAVPPGCEALKTDIVISHKSSNESSQALSIQTLEIDIDDADSFRSTEDNSFPEKFQTATPNSPETNEHAKDISQPDDITAAKMFKMEAEKDGVDKTISKSPANDTEDSVFPEGFQTFPTHSSQMSAADETSYISSEDNATFGTSTIATPCQSPEKDSHINGTYLYPNANNGSEEFRTTSPDIMKKTPDAKATSSSAEENVVYEGPKASPMSPEIGTSPKSPISPKMTECLEAEDGMRSSNVDTGQSIAGW